MVAASTPRASWAASKGSTITLETEGEDEVEAMEALAGLISSGFGEELV